MKKQTPQRAACDGWPPPRNVAKVTRPPKATQRSPDRPHRKNTQKKPRQSAVSIVHPEQLEHVTRSHADGTWVGQ
jgi:hypothetical protein